MPGERGRGTAEERQEQPGRVSALRWRLQPAGTPVQHPERAELWSAENSSGV